MSRTGIIRSKPDGSFVEVLPDGSERPYCPPEPNWETLEAVSDEQIEAAALADPDAQPLTDGQLAKMRRPRGRPRKGTPKVPTTVRLDADVLEFFRRSGPNWQTRLNEALRKAAGL